MEKLKKLLELMAQHGGKIVCTASLDTMQINQARASERMFVDENSIGFVWQPDITKMPETKEEIAFFEKWFPLDEPLPESLKNLDWFHDCEGSKCNIPNCVVCKNEMY